MGNADETIFINEDVVNMLPVHLPNYYHWVTEGIPRSVIMQFFSVSQTKYFFHQNTPIVQVLLRSSTSTQCPSVAAQQSYHIFSTLSANDTMFFQFQQQFNFVWEFVARIRLSFPSEPISYEPKPRRRLHRCSTVCYQLA